jgi:ATP-dependent RNA helicase DeaD
MTDIKIKFEDFGFKKSILEGLNNAGFKVPSPIQEKAIPEVMKGGDIVAQAHTGTGKTAAFGLPSLNSIKHSGNIEMLVIAPTRELAIQVGDELYKLGKFEKVKSLTVYGGQSYGRQIDAIQRKPEILVATPGRLLDLIKKGYLKSLKPSTVVLDEADEMLDMGFLEDIQEVFSFLPEKRQTLLFSATMPDQIKKLANRILNNPKLISVTDSKKHTVNTSIVEKYCVIRDYERDDAMIRIIDDEDVKKSILFCRTKREVDRVTNHLVSQGYAAGSLHGDMEQGQRQSSIKSFQSGKIAILVATDVAARGLDINDVEIVFNYHIPFESESYVHRIGRTGRAGKSGTAITLVTISEFHKLKRFKSIIGGEMAHYVIPSRREMQKKATSKLLDLISATSPSKQSISCLDKILETSSLEDIARKMMTYILELENIVGPEYIGLKASEVDNIMKRSRSNYSGNRDRGRSGGGYRNSNPRRSSFDNKRDFRKKKY